MWTDVGVDGGLLSLLLSALKAGMQAGPKARTTGLLATVEVQQALRAPELDVLAYESARDFLTYNLGLSSGDVVYPFRALCLSPTV